MAWPSGSDLEQPWADPYLTWSGHGPLRRRFGIGWDRIGSDFNRIGLDLNRIGSDLVRIVSDIDRIGSDLARIRTQFGYWKHENHCFSIGFCMFYACLGNVGLHAILGPTCTQLGLILCHLGPTLDRLGPNFVHLGTTWSQSWPS